MRLTEKIRYQVPILNLASRLGLETQGGASCPFCQAATGLGFEPGDNRFRCQACGRQGSQIELVQQQRRLGYEEAVAWLQATYQIPDDAATEGLLDAWRRETRKPSLDAVFGGAAERRTGARADAAEQAIYEEILAASPMAEPASSFLERRGYPQDLVTELRLGWIGSPAELCERLEARHGRDGLREAGLITPAGSFAFNHHRLLVPFMVEGRPRFIRARRLDGGKPEWTSLVRKRAPIFPHARLAKLQPGATVVLVPDVPDALALIIHGVNAFALLGFERRPAEELEPFLAHDVVLCGEPDDAGRAFNRALASHFDALRKDVRVGELPPGFGDWNAFRLFKRA